MHAFARVTVCVCVWGGGAPLSGEEGGICPKCPPYGDATAARRASLNNFIPPYDMGDLYMIANQLSELER